MDGDWLIYLLAAAGLVAGHAVPALPALRAGLIEWLGRSAYLAAYSVLSLAVLMALVWAYGRIGSGPWLYLPLPQARPLAVALMPVAFFLVLGRLTTRADAAPLGIYRLSRAPGSTGVLLWALLHLVNTGDARRVVLFLAMAAIAGVALAKNEWLLRQRAGAGEGSARVWLAHISVLPLAGPLRGGGWPRLREIGAWRLLLALAGYGTVLWLHPYWFGVDPLAGL